MRIERKMDSIDRWKWKNKKLGHLGRSRIKIKSSSNGWLLFIGV